MRNHTTDNLSTTMSALNIISVSFGGIFTIGLCAVACYQKLVSCDKTPQNNNSPNEYKLFPSESSSTKSKHLLCSKTPNNQPRKKRKLNPPNHCERR